MRTAIALGQGGSLEKEYPPLRWGGSKWGKMWCAMQGV